MVSLKSKYGLRAIVSLADNFGKGHLQAKEIASQQDVPVRYLELLLSQLRRARMVDATRGKNGGYILTKEPAEITIWDVVSIFEGKTLFSREEQPGKANGNGNGNGQIYNQLWREAETRIVDYLKSVKISDLVESINSGEDMYFI